MLATHGRYLYSPITDRPAYRWPNGTGLAVYFALGVEDYRFGEGLAENILPGASHPDLVNTAWRDYGNRVGGFRLLDRFAAYGISPAVLLNTAVYDQAPALTDALRRAGCEIVAHGQTNSDSLALMEPDRETSYVRDTMARILREEGAPARGWSSPWLAHSAQTLDILAEQGVGYLLDLRLDDQPVWLRTRTTPLLAIPYAAELNDSSTIIGRNASARDFADMIVDEFDEMLADSRDRPLVMSVVVHSFISGAPFRLRALTRALDHLASQRESIWITQPGAIAAYMAANPHCAV